MNQNQAITTASSTLAPRDVPGLDAGSSLLQIGLVIAAVGILAASAWLSVPFYPVPLTMQTLAVLLIGGLLGPRLGTAAVLGYLAVGLAGAPVFHNGLGGPAVVLGPTGGYLLGFVPAALVMGMVSCYAGAALRGIALLATGAVLAEAAIYAVGVPWLAVAYTGGNLGRAIAVGAVPYLLGDLLKVAVAVGALRLSAAAGSRRRSSLL